MVAHRSAGASGAAVPAVTARPATWSDLGQMAGLCRESQAALVAWRGGGLLIERQGLAEPLTDSLAVLMDTPSARAWMGTLDDHVVGWASAHTEALSSAGLLGVLDAIFVEEPARGVGVGEAMMEAMIDWLTGLGCIGVDASALPGCRQAKGFLESAGFKARLIVMHRALPSCEVT